MRVFALVKISIYESDMLPDIPNSLTCELIRLTSSQVEAEKFIREAEEGAKKLYREGNWDFIDNGALEAKVERRKNDYGFEVTFLNIKNYKYADKYGFIEFEV